MKKLIAVALLCAPSGAFAAPVYLDCYMSDGSKDVLWNVTIDEEQARVDYIIPALSVSQKKPAIFTPDKVVFNGMEISRIDLTFKRDLFGKVDVGKCKLAVKKERAF